jgi:hypothetical protein
MTIIPDPAFAYRNLAVEHCGLGSSRDIGRNHGFNSDADAAPQARPESRPWRESCLRWTIVALQ